MLTKLIYLADFIHVTFSRNIHGFAIYDTDKLN